MTRSSQTDERKGMAGRGAQQAVCGGKGGFMALRAAWGRGGMQLWALRDEHAEGEGRPSLGGEGRMGSQGGYRQRKQWCVCV